MYKIIGLDGKEYGPFDLQEMRQWISQGRIDGQTQVQGPGAAAWNPAASYPELGFAATPTSRPPPPPPPPPGQRTPQQTALATTSLVLGILSLVCFGLLAGIPAIICGHVARGRARRSPGQYGGAGSALAGVVMGYASLFVTLVILPALLLPALARAKDKAQRISCSNNMKQIGLAIRTWAIDNDGNYPFQVSTSHGGSMELCQPGTDGFDSNAAYHFRVISNELSTTKILVCPADTGKQPALDFTSLEAANVSYQLRSGKEVTETNPQEILAVCPIHNNVLRCDGSVVTERKTRK